MYDKLGCQSGFSPCPWNLRIWWFESADLQLYPNQPLRHAKLSLDFLPTSSPAFHINELTKQSSKTQTTHWQMAQNWLSLELQDLFVAERSLWRNVFHQFPQWNPCGTKKHAPKSLWTKHKSAAFGRPSSPPAKPCLMTMFVHSHVWLFPASITLDAKHMFVGPK